MTLPFSRNTTYTPGSPLKSADLNDMQDGEVGGLHGFRWDAVEPFNAGASAAGSYVTDAWLLDAADSVTIRAPIAFGDIVRAVAVRCEPHVDRAAQLQVLPRVDNDDSGVVVGLSVTSPGSPGAYTAGWQWLVADFGEGTELVVPDPEHYLSLVITTTGLGAAIPFVKMMMLTARASAILSPPLAP